VNLNLLIILAIGLASCGRNNTTQGSELAHKHCIGCHEFPEPALLSKGQWRDHVLPQMAAFMQVDTNQDSPNKNQIGRREWSAIVEYYLSRAPETLPKPNIPKLDTLQQFRVELPPNRFGIPSLTLLRNNESGGYFLSDANAKSWIELRRDFSIAKAGAIAEGGVDVLTWKQDRYSLFMGSFSPTDAPTGLLLKHPSGAIERAFVIHDSLQRPVCMRAHDWNNDGAPDFVVCEFGKFSGSLSLLSSQKDGSLKRTVIQTSPGAISAELRDVNKDGHMDIIALFAQANERIDLMLSDGKGAFKTQTLIRFPASYGSSSMKLHDLDGDGVEELLYTAGDNADFPAITKPYHGIYVYSILDGFQLKKSAFYPLPGAYAVHPADYDGDGTQELACISFFPDWLKQAELGFVIIKPGNESTSRYAFIPKLHQAGRWITMETTDADDDGDIDILLGSMTMETSPSTPLAATWANNKIPFVLLRNLLH
jgi:hypothetical protein